MSASALEHLDDELKQIMQGVGALKKELKDAMSKDITKKEVEKFHDEDATVNAKESVSF